MKVFAVDIQGFTLNGAQRPKFIAKEVAISNGQQVNHYLFESPMTYASLSAANKKIVSRATFHYHGLHFARGNINYDRMNEIIKRALFSCDVVYVKNGANKDFLDKILNGSGPNIIDIESTDWSIQPNWSTQPSYPKCMEHLPDKSYVCSFRNCIEIHDWVYNILPQ